MKGHMTVSDTSRGSVKLAALTALTASAFLLAACDDDPTGVTEPGQVSLSVTGAPGATSSLLASSVQTTDPDNRSLLVESVRMVFFEIELEVGDDVEGVDLKAGPILIDLPLDGSVSTILSQAAVPPNRYDELEMEVKPVEGDESEAEFASEHPGWPLSQSIQVTGTFDADDGEGPQSFDIFLNFNDDFELEFEPALEIGKGEGLSLVLAIDVGTWFLNEDGTLIDPRTLSGDSSAASQVEDNIEDSFEAFEDSQENEDQEDDA